MGAQARVERSSMDGGSRIVLHSTHIAWPYALTIDLPTKTIYWADAKLHSIESSDYYGQHRRQVLTSGVHHPFGMAVLEDLVYWSDWSKPSILSTVKNVSCNLNRGHNLILTPDETSMQNLSSLYTNLLYPMDIRAIHPVLQPFYRGGNPCAQDHTGTGACNHLCLLSADKSQGFSCACPDGTESRNNGVDCFSK